MRHSRETPHVPGVIYMRHTYVASRHRPIGPLPELSLGAADLPNCHRVADNALAAVRGPLALNHSNHTPSHQRCHHVGPPMTDVLSVLLLSHAAQRAVLDLAGADAFVA